MFGFLSFIGYFLVGGFYYFPGEPVGEFSNKCLKPVYLPTCLLGN